MALFKTIKRYYKRRGTGSEKKLGEIVRRGSQRSESQVYGASKELHLPYICQADTVWDPSQDSVGVSLGNQSSESVLNARYKCYRQGPEVKQLKRLQDLDIVRAQLSPVTSLNTSHGYEAKSYPLNTQHTQGRKIAPMRSPVPGVAASSPAPRGQVACRTPVGRSKSGLCPSTNTKKVLSPTNLRSRSLSDRSTSPRYIPCSASSSPLPQNRSGSGPIGPMSDAIHRRGNNHRSAMGHLSGSQHSVRTPQSRSSLDVCRLSNMFPNNSPRMHKHTVHSESRSMQTPSPTSRTSLVTQHLVLSNMPSTSDDGLFDPDSESSIASVGRQVSIFVNGPSPASSIPIKGRKAKKAMEPLEERLSSSFRRRLETQHRVQFEDIPIVSHTFHSTEYDRKTPLTSPKKAQMMQIYRQLMTFKLTEMQVHPESYTNTNKHLSKLNTEDRAGMVREIEFILANFSRNHAI